MTKYPIKHTMEFGESEYGDWWCSNCEDALAPSRVTYQERCDACGHPVVWVEGTTHLSVTFDLWKECPVCHGNKIIPNKTPYRNMIDCPNCNEVYGKVPRYWTPEDAAEHIKKETGIDWEWPEDTPVYYLSGGGWRTKSLGYVTRANFPHVIAIFGQPAPLLITDRIEGQKKINKKLDKIYLWRAKR